MIITLWLIFSWENKNPHYFSMGMFSPLFFTLRGVGSNVVGFKRKGRLKLDIFLKIRTLRHQVLYV